MGGIDMVVAVYQDEFEPDGWGRLEIYHDPSVGFLPRFARRTVGGSSGGTCKEYFLIKARPCSAGGFVPTEVYEANFDIDRPIRTNALEFDSQAPAPPPRSKIYLRRLEAAGFKDFKGPVGLVKLENVKFIATRGGTTPLTTKAPLTLSRLKTMLGRKLTDPAPSGFPAIDTAELNEFAVPPRTNWLWYCLAIAAAFVVGAACLWRWRRFRAALLIAAVDGLGPIGCSPAASPVLRLAGAFDRAFHPLRRGANNPAAHVDRAE